ncbi:MAG: MarR family transcriptional regulator [Pirellulales bacterium]|nr:MarR family transcriptional regulator [Pirellulales bacterium]
MSDPASPEEVTELVLLILDVYGTLHDNGARITAPFGQTPARWQVMGQLAQEELTVSQIARRIGNTRQAVQRLANEMASAGIVEFFGNPDHKRSEKLRLTDEGRSIFRRINIRQKQWATSLGSRISSRRLRQTIRGLEQLAKSLEEENPDAS